VPWERPEIVNVFRRFCRMRLTVDVPREKVAEQVASAVMRNRNHVRLPRRAVVFPMPAEVALRNRFQAVAEDRHIGEVDVGRTRGPFARS
jgi:hypothetical protein